MEFLWEGLLSITWPQAVMYVVGAVLIWLAIKKDYEPSLLLPMGFGAILVNLPSSGVLNQVMEGVGETHGIIPVSYTHLDVYKRQAHTRPFCKRKPPQGCRGGFQRGKERGEINPIRSRCICGSCPC